MNMQVKKKLFVIEGLDGSGKATQAALLGSSLSSNHRVRNISFPNYDSDSSALVKMYLAGEFGDRPEDVNAYAASTFYAVDRYASFKKDWKTDYNGGIVIADRYTTSNAIHQCSKLPNEKWDGYLKWLFDFEYEMLGIPAPNLVIYLKANTIISQKLLTTRYDGNDEKKDIHEKNLDYLRRCQEAADYCASTLGWCVVECIKNGSMRSIDDIHTEVSKLLFEKLVL